MRDIKRIKVFCNQLAELWETNCPDLRFSQLLACVLDDGVDRFLQKMKICFCYSKITFINEIINFFDSLTTTVRLCVLALLLITLPSLCCT